jgi:hypothetical protein
VEPEGSWLQSQVLILWLFRNMIRFYGEELLTSRPTRKLEDHFLSAFRDCKFNIFAATLYVYIWGRSSIRNPRARYAVVTGTHLSQFAIKHLAESAPY